MTNENLLYSLIQNADLGSLLVAQDLAMEMNCGLPITYYHNSYSMSLLDDHDYILPRAGINGRWCVENKNRYLSFIGSRAGTYEHRHSYAGNRNVDSENHILRR